MIKENMTFKDLRYHIKKEYKDFYKSHNSWKDAFYIKDFMVFKETRNCKIKVNFESPKLYSYFTFDIVSGLSYYEMYQFIKLLLKNKNDK